MGCARNVSVQKFRDGAWTFLAQPHTDEGSEHTLHLLLQESITPHDESDSETDLLDLEGEYVLYSRLKHPMRIGGKRHEVMPSDKTAHSILHYRNIKPFVHEHP